MLSEVRCYNSVHTSFLLLHRHALASEALPEYLKIVLKHVTERVNFIKARALVFKVL